MPIYGFECPDCDHRFDRLQKLSDPDPSSCPACGSAQVRRQITAPAFRLAGSGWYETDFKKDGDKKRNLASSGDEGSKSDSKSEAKSETKSETKSEAKPESKPASTDSKPAAAAASS
ncbi:FmdB family zinc ribbon protein [Pseudomarimonas arenosa]|uniref:Zinc ribbon domain-containing protein n=1 Tax=Pseudomarimonas arenosa TaxID=2774145 RepID=A0AAW3ZFN3_9GAMM|nr:zinc ribbon domain-containing protein [Pseudomarimonas arenosa]MBD8524169.1 zinc ribbon domain-containing protein [Pseudomarimonas arenosa]